MPRISKTTSAAGFDKAFSSILDDFQDLLGKDIDKAVKAGAKAAVDELRETSPKKTGRYAKGWAMKVDKTAALGSTAIVYNKTDWQLAHLLELGHQQFWMGHDTGKRTPGIPHIAPAGEVGAEKMLEELK